MLRVPFIALRTRTATAVVVATVGVPTAAAVVVATVGAPSAVVVATVVVHSAVAVATVFTACFKHTLFFDDFS